MSMINSSAATDLAASAKTLNAPALSVASSEKVTAFNKLLYAGTPQGDVGVLSPPQMLVQQANILSTTVGVDLGAKIAGAVSQSVNKLANMT
ncbi:type III secretion system inner rod subunit SctI [Yersinia aldovae]|uniref:type III secretion system inner rod subunit SctI n=1 Tax=Yersinia aldovae TaxID=29483 RepID=UPI0021BD04AB|nr:type III secretion system inner rod subunit SctI [Yersinia aldovae]